MPAYHAIEAGYLPSVYYTFFSSLVIGGQPARWQLATASEESTSIIFPIEHTI